MRTLLMTLMCSVVLLFTPRSAFADGAQTHVRALDSCAAATMARALAHSGTVRALGDRLARTDVVAYVSCVWPETNSPSASLVWVSGTTSLRYVLLRVSHRLSPARRVEMLGHEMQHAVEVSEAPWVRDEATLQQLFERIGRQTTVCATYETVAAQQIERAVRRDLATEPPPPLPVGTVLADASRPASGTGSPSASGEGGSLTAGSAEQGEIRVAALPQIQERLVALQAGGRLPQRGVGPSLPKKGQRIKH